MEKFFTETRFKPVDFDPFKGPAIERTVPSTEPQREVFIASRMGPEASCAYNESVSLVLIGPLDRSVLERGINLLVQRHDGLRSVMSDNGLRVVVFTEGAIAPAFTDISALLKEEREARLAAIADADMRTPFDLVNGPLFRAHLVRTGPDEHLLRLTGHHVVIDGWSMGIIMAELSRIHSALVAGTPTDLPPAVPFSAYAMAMIDHARSPEHGRVEQYWLDQFKGPLPRVELPTDRPRPERKTYNGARLDMELEASVLRGLKEVATRSGSSFVTTLLTAFEVLIYKLTGDSDLVIGLPAAGQSDTGMKHLVGHCVNLLALRSRIDERVPFMEHLKRRRTAVLDAYDHQRYTFGTLVRKLNVPREPGRIPLAPVVFNIDMNMDDGVRFTGLRHKFISNPRRYENFELFLNATGNDDHLVLEWSYNTDLFDARSVRGWMDELVRIAQRIATDPGATIEELIGDAALASDQALPPEEWIGRSSPYPANKSISELFDQVVERHGDRTALELLDRKLSYHDLQHRAIDLSARLMEAGVRPGDPVGLCADRSFEMIAAMLGVLRCGACFVPFDPGYPAERLQFMFADTRVKALLTQKHLSTVLPPHDARTILIDTPAPRAATAPDTKDTPGSAAYIMYTSGSTGRPKGVVVPHRAIVRLVRDQDFLPFGPDLVFLQLSNISFDASTLEIWGALLNGGRLVLQPQQKPTLVEISDTIRDHGVTTVWFTAGLFNLMVDEHVDRLRGLKHILAGGDVLSVPHVKKALKAVGAGVLINGYGPTENTTFTCCHAIDGEAGIKGSVPIGRPIRNTRAYVLDEHQRPVGIGRKGELYVGGAGVALGYWEREDLNAERFLPDPFSKEPGARMYRTGDLVRWLPDGTLEFIGRTDDQVKVRGFRIELGEIENALNGHALVKDRVVIVRGDLPGEKQLVCYIVPHAAQHSNDPATQQQLIATVREHLRERLPEHMVPTAFVVMADLPLTPNGKVDRKALPAPEQRTQTLRARYVAPRDHLERVLAAIWGQLLGVERIGIHENFFELGGHSLIGIQILAQVEQQLGKELSLQSLFQAPTIAEFARLLQQGGAEVRWTNLSPIQPDGDRAPFFCVHGDEANYFIPRHLGTDQPFYAFFHQGEDGSPIRYTTVHEIARHFIEEMRSVRPHGPYLLGGYSFGGIVAYEMAQQLHDAGEEVPLLALFDTYDPLEYAADMARGARWYDPAKNLVYRWLGQRALRKHGRIENPKVRHHYIIDTYDKAITSYRPEPFTGAITVFKASATTGPDHMGWERLAKGGVDVVHITGDHYNLIKEPHVRLLTAELAKRIDRALSKRSVEAV